MMREADNNSGREVAGLIIILIGFGLLMNTMNIFPTFPFLSLLHRFWVPALFIGIGALLLSRRGPQDGMGAGLFFIVLGAFFFLGALDMGSFGFRRWIGPAILIWLGVAILMKGQRSRYQPPPPPSEPSGPSAPSGQAAEPPNNPGTGFDRPRFERHAFRPEQYTDSSDFIRATVILGSFNRRCPSPRFRGGDLTAIMGGGKIDLREAQIQDKEAVLDIFTLMGGIEIQVPDGWIVEPRFTPILGGYQDRTSRVTQGTQRLVINGTAIMGGVTVFN
jgi:hypothetical protein